MTMQRTGSPSLATLQGGRKKAIDDATVLAALHTLDKGRPRLVIVSSPLDADYAKKAIQDCLFRGDAAHHPHLFYTQSGVLDPAVSNENDLCLLCGLAWGFAADASAFYVDAGITDTMALEMESAVDHSRPMEFRSFREGSSRLLFEIQPVKFSSGDLTLRLFGPSQDKASLLKAVAEALVGETAPCTKWTLFQQETPEGWLLALAEDNMLVPPNP